MKKFKKGQKIIAKLPTGRMVEGFYEEPFGQNGHSFYVMEFSGIGKGGEPVYKKATYGVNEDLIEAAPKSDNAPSVKQYKAWLARAIDLKNRIKESNKIISALADSPDKAREVRKLSRYETKLSAIEAKITEYEDLMD